MASGTSQPQYFFVAISSYSLGHKDFETSFFWHLAPPYPCAMLIKSLSNTGLLVIIFFCNTESGLSAFVTVMISCLFGTFFKTICSQLSESKTWIEDLMKLIRFTHLLIKAYRFYLIRGATTK